MNRNMNRNMNSHRIVEGIDKERKKITNLTPR